MVGSMRSPLVVDSALITGGRRGIGKAISQELAARGIRVTSLSRESFDMSQPEEVQSWIRDFEGEIPYLLVCNAGINIPESLATQSTEAVRKILQCNFFAHVELISFFAPRMADLGGGRIVVISSAYANKARVGRSAYSSSKAALDAYMRSAALEFANRNVLVNSIAPGFVATDLTIANNTANAIDEITKRIPIGRLATTQEVAKAVSFIGSEENTYITGQVLNVDGGFSLT